MWNYGSLNDEQESDYIKAKMIMVNKDFNKFVEVVFLRLMIPIHRLQNITFSELVVKCQKLIRKFAFEQLQKISIKTAPREIYTLKITHTLLSQGRISSAIVSKVKQRSQYVLC